MTTTRHVMATLLALHLTGCLSDDDDSIDTSTDEAEVRGDPKNINIGFDGAAGGWGVEQFQYFPVFFNASAIHPGPRLCHTYVVWNVASEPAGMGTSSSPQGHRPAFEYWLAHAQTDGHCDEVLVSFKADAGARCADGTQPPCDPPTATDVRTAWQRFLDQPWQAETGYTGKFAFTPWNEPNNEGAAGNGLGKVIPPGTAAHYYLILASLCASHDCKVAAGDLASNGTWWNDFEWNCANDNIENLTVIKNGVQFCRHPSPLNPGNHKPASYLDRFKNYIALHWHEHPGLDSRPDYFAFHGWHDANEYLDTGSHCGSYDDCVTRRVIKSLSGSWGGVTLWDTEVGASQGEDVTDEAQACDASFLLRVTALSARIKRIYYTRMYNGGAHHGGELVTGTSPATATPRAAGMVLANRNTDYKPPGRTCR